MGRLRRMLLRTPPQLLRFVHDRRERWSACDDPHLQHVPAVDERQRSGDGHRRARAAEPPVRRLLAGVRSPLLDRRAERDERDLRAVGLQAELLGRRPEPGLLLLVDLRRLHRKAAGVSLDWELLAQGAQAAKDPDLLALSQQCHPQTLRQMKWANAMLKTLSPQILAS